MVGSRSTAPRKRSWRAWAEKFVYLSLAAEIEPEGRRFADFGTRGGVLSWHFESYPLVPGCHTLLILHGIAETFGLDAELA
jgi:hypothetical protein